ncbi:MULTISPECIES: class I SAM-dependent methyltransferase [Bacillaceae]|uniref:SAM-dependent methyltransferase n=1 Tax=Alkalicoccobacillus plakortidis TaxID=444060 RepID=A0A9D5DW74_9BACI|nr:MULTISPECIES: class I SAM-dependent methyltransferase [Bacillaceae]KQL58018.1 SAM-dependent methyltransferase [Alkalicoccobacillus plakortidis]
MEKSSKEQFGAYAEAYVTSNLHAKGKDLAVLEHLVKEGDAQSIIDIATGGGHVAKKLAAYTKDIVAVDLTPEMLSVAKKHLSDAGIDHVQYVEAAAENLPFEDERFDLAVNRIAAHHFMNVPKFLDETYRILSKEGRFFLLDNVALEDDGVDSAYNQLEKKRDASHIRAYKKSEWLQMVEKAGFTVKRMHTFEKPFLFQDWTDRVQFTTTQKQELSQWMSQLPASVKAALFIKEDHTGVHSFMGQSILLEAIKA